MHESQRRFCEGVRGKFPEFFRSSRVVDFGSLDINGNNRYLFEISDYLGVDIGPGPNVDIVCRAKDVVPPFQPTVVISTEMLEHDEEWEDSLRRMVEIVKPGGLIVFTCATTGRPEHGTRKSSPGDAPFVGDYYRNLTEEDIRQVWDVENIFKEFSFEVGPPADLRFWGIVRESKDVDFADKIAAREFQTGDGELSSGSG